MTIYLALHAVTVVFSHVYFILFLMLIFMVGLAIAVEKAHNKIANMNTKSECKDCTCGRTTNKGS